MTVSPTLLSISSFSRSICCARLSSAIAVMMRLISSGQNIVIACDRSLKLSRLTSRLPPSFKLIFRHLLRSVISPSVIRFLSVSQENVTVHQSLKVMLFIGVYFLQIPLCCKHLCINHALIYSVLRCKLLRLSAFCNNSIL